MRTAKPVEIAAWLAGWTTVIALSGWLIAATARALHWKERRTAPPWAIDWVEVVTPEPSPRGWRDAGDPRARRTALVLLAIEQSTSKRQTDPVRTPDVHARYSALSPEEPVSLEDLERTIEKLLRDGLVARRRGRGLWLTELGRDVLAETRGGDAPDEASPASTGPEARSGGRPGARDATRDGKR